MAKRKLLETYEEPVGAVSMSECANITTSTCAAAAVERADKACLKAMEQGYKGCDAALFKERFSDRAAAECRVRHMAAAANAGVVHAMLGGACDVQRVQHWVNAPAMHGAASRCRMASSQVARTLPAYSHMFCAVCTAAPTGRILPWS